MVRGDHHASADRDAAIRHDGSQYARSESTTKVPSARRDAGAKSDDAPAHLHAPARCPTVWRHRPVHPVTCRIPSTLGARPARAGEVSAYRFGTVPTRKQEGRQGMSNISPHTSSLYGHDLHSDELSVWSFVPLPGYSRFICSSMPLFHHKKCSEVHI